MDYCFTLLLLETVSSTAWARILICLTCNTLNIRSIASNIKLIRLALLRRPLMLLGMKRPITTYSACLALGGGLSVFDRYESRCGAHSEASSAAPDRPRGPMPGSRARC